MGCVQPRRRGLQPGRAAVTSLFLLPTLVLVVDASGSDFRVGCNVGGDGRAFVFADLIRGQTPTFGVWGNPVNGIAPVDSDGWPTSDFAAVPYREGIYPVVPQNPAATIGGIYTIVASGNATLLTPPAPVWYRSAIPYKGHKIINQTYDILTNRLTGYLNVSFDTTLVGGFIEVFFNDTKRDPRDPNSGGGLANISFFMPGYPADTHPDTFSREHMRPFWFCKAVRFMPWTLAASSSGIALPSSVSWADRAMVGSRSYTLGTYNIIGPGVPWELIAQFCNTLGTDAWVNVPPGRMDQAANRSAAIDEYVVNLVTLMDARLAPGRRIYVEFSNEIWNSHFLGFQVNAQLANHSVMEEGDPHNLNWGLPTPPDPAYLYTHWAVRHIGWITIRIAQLAARVVGADRVGPANMPGVRVVPVMPCQQGWAGQGEIMLKYITAVHGPPTSVGIGAMAMGAYVTMGARNADNNATTDDVIDGFFGVIANLTAGTGHALSSPFAGYSALSAYYRVDVVAYEGSPDTSSPPGVLLPLMIAKAGAIMDPRMEGITINNLRMWQSWGFGMFMWFMASSTQLTPKWGSYSVSWDNMVLDTPKARGLTNITSGPPMPAAVGWPLPMYGHSANFYIGFYTASGDPPPPMVPITWLPENTQLRYMVRLPPTLCAPRVAVYMCTSNATAADRPLEVSVGIFAPTLLIQSPPYKGACSGATAAFTAVTAEFPLLDRNATHPEGLLAVTLRVPIALAGYQLQSLDVWCHDPLTPSVSPTTTASTTQTPSNTPSTSGTRTASRSPTATRSESVAASSTATGTTTRSESFAASSTGTPTHLVSQSASASGATPSVSRSAASGTPSVAAATPSGTPAATSHAPSVSAVASGPAIASGAAASPSSSPSPSPAASGAATSTASGSPVAGAASGSSASSAAPAASPSISISRAPGAASPAVAAATPSPSPTGWAGQAMMLPAGAGVFDPQAAGATAKLGVGPALRSAPLQVPAPVRLAWIAIRSNASGADVRASLAMSSSAAALNLAPVAASADSAARLLWLPAATGDAAGAGVPTRWLVFAPAVGSSNATLPSETTFTVTVASLAGGPIAAVLDSVAATLAVRVAVDSVTAPASVLGIGALPADMASVSVIPAAALSGAGATDQAAASGSSAAAVIAGVLVAAGVVMAVTVAVIMIRRRRLSRHRGFHNPKRKAAPAVHPGAGSSQPRGNTPAFSSVAEVDPAVRQSVELSVVNPLAEVASARPAGRARHSMTPVPTSWTAAPREQQPPLQGTGDAQAISRGQRVGLIVGH